MLKHGGDTFYNIVPVDWSRWYDTTLRENAFNKTCEFWCKKTSDPGSQAGWGYRQWEVIAVGIK